MYDRKIFRAQTGLPDIEQEERVIPGVIFNLMQLIPF